MCKEGVEEDSNRLAAGGDAEGVECDDEEELGGAREADGEDRENCKDQGGGDFEGDFVGEIGSKESGNAVGAVVVFFVENVALKRVDAHVLQHANEDHCTKIISPSS